MIISKLESDEEKKIQARGKKSIDRKRTYSEGGRDRRIAVGEDVLEKSFEVESFAVEMWKVLKIPNAMIDNCLGFLFRNIAFLLSLSQESLEVINGHHSVLGVPLEELLDLARSFRGGESESPPEAEADSVGLFGHVDGAIPCPVNGEERERGGVWFRRWRNGFCLDLDQVLYGICFVVREN